MGYDEVPPDEVRPQETKVQHLKQLDTVIALYDFPGTQPSHLPLRLGDSINVLSKSDTGWWDGVIAGNNGDLQRGWFPHNYVRSVNYVQPVLNKLQSNKEIDSITAANTAANVLIPSFTSLLQKNLLGDSEKNSPNNSTRKNSVVSFASSETSLHSDGKQERRSSKVHQDDEPLTTEHEDHHNNSIQTFQEPDTEHKDSISTQSDSIHAYAERTVSMDQEPSIPSINVVSVEEAESMADKYCSEHHENVVWHPKSTTGGDLIFYSHQLDVYSEIMPLTRYNSDKIDFETFSVLPPEVLENASTAILHTTSSSSNNNAGNTNQLLNAEYGDDASNKFHRNASHESLKRDSATPSMASSQSTTHYHHFKQPFYAMCDLFYKHPTDLTQWSELRTQIHYILDLCLKALKDYSKQLFNAHFSALNKLVSLLASAARLQQNDFLSTKYESSLKRKLRRIVSSYAQIYINGVLHLNVMHHSPHISDSQLFSNDINALNRSDANDSCKSSLSTIGNNDSEGNFPLRNPSVSTITGKTYIQQIGLEVDTLRYNLDNFVKIFMKITKDKRVKKSDYDGSDVSDDDGEERYDILPQLYPRFLTDEFNGGNWCNPFFASSNPVLNASGNDLKNRHHSKVLIDRDAHEKVLTQKTEAEKIANSILEALDPANRHTYYNKTLIKERNTEILRSAYKYLFHAGLIMDVLESFDFTVFCLIRKWDTNSSPNNEGDSDNGSKDSPSEELLKDWAGAYERSGLTFDYPVVLDFFQFKQQFHDHVSKAVMTTQALTLEDPDVFRAVKEDEDLLYDRDVIKLPTERASRMLARLMTEKIEKEKGESMSLNPDTTMTKTLHGGLKLLESMSDIVHHLIEERETILNYATRVMHDDVNMQLLVIERNNTSLSEKAEEGHSFYGSKKQTSNVPWYLEGDEEFDLLLDLKGNIKGGTKEALVAHLTHHDQYDSAFTSSFLFSFATVTTLGELLTLMINRFNIDAPEGLSFEEYNTWISQKQAPIRLKVISVMRLLLEKYWVDSYHQEPILERWLAFAQSPSVQSLSGGKILSADIQRVLDGEKICFEREPTVVPGRPPAPLTRGSKKFKLLDIDYVELARQLTIREFKLYSKITKHACIAKVWGRKSGLSESTESIAHFIKASNQLTNFVAYMILRKPDVKKRVQVIRYFVQVAEKCRQYNNFSSMTAIISALYSSSVHRLKKTWRYVSPETAMHLQSMNRLMNSSRNFNEYRDVLKFIGSEPCVPFFGVYLSDLTFVYHGNPDYLMNRTRMINFAKRSKTTEIVSGIDRFKTTAYNLQEVSEIQAYLDSWFDKCPSIDEQYQLSLNLEPRESTSSGNSGPRNQKSSLGNFVFNKS
ncbi:Cell division control protein 25 [Meyerozyma sp. JA9]|nr:Cell division control protein 25 [Meyerozyma sp. JA9]